MVRFPGKRRVRLRRGGGVNFAGSRSSFLTETAPCSNKAFNARFRLACERARVPVISAHPTAATLLLNERGTFCHDVSPLRCVIRTKLLPEEFPCGFFRKRSALGFLCGCMFFAAPA